MSSIESRTGSYWGWVRPVGNTVLALTLAACQPATQRETPKPKAFHFPTGAVFLTEPRPGATVCGTLKDPRDGIRIETFSYYDMSGGSHQIFEGYSAQELALCPDDTDGKIWYDTGIQNVPIIPPVG